MGKGEKRAKQSKGGWGKVGNGHSVSKFGGEKTKKVSTPYPEGRELIKYPLPIQ